MNDYDLRCSWCDARLPDKQARIFHEQEEHGMTDEQINRFLGGKSRWDTHEADTATYAGSQLAMEAEHKPYGPGLNVTVPRAEPAASDARYDHDVYDEGDITEADIVVTMRAQGLGLPPVALVTAGSICQQAADITAGDRQQQNGDKLPNHENIAALWSAYLDVAIDAHQAATMMVLLKVARTKLGAFNTDDYVDMAGYAGCAAEIRHRSNQEHNAWQ